MTKITTLEELHKLRTIKRSVFCPNARCLSKPRPAAFIINLQGHVLLMLFRSGMYLYEKEKK